MVDIRCHHEAIARPGAAGDQTIDQRLERLNMERKPHELYAVMGMSVGRSHMHQPFAPCPRA